MSVEVRWLARGEAALPATEDWLTPRESQRGARMAYAKRRNEYLLGRWTAKHGAARILGRDPDAPTLAALEIRNLPSGAPAVFADGARLDIQISMTDRAGWAVCAVGGPPGGLGCDLEVVEPRSERFVADYFTPFERATVVAAEPEHHPVLTNLIWSAKESALKVLQTGLRRDTRSVEVELGEDGAGWTPLTVTAVEGPRFPGWWRRYGDFVLTFAATRPIDPPVSLEEPPGLATAAPTHTWLTQPRLTT